MGGRLKEDQPSSTDSLHDEKKEEIKQSMMSRIIILKLIVKAGKEVPENRRKAMKNDMWPEFHVAEKTELSAFDEFDVWTLMPAPADANVVGVRWV